MWTSLCRRVIWQRQPCFGCQRKLLSRSMSTDPQPIEPFQSEADFDAFLESLLDPSLTAPASPPSSSSAAKHTSALPKRQYERHRLPSLNRYVKPPNMPEDVELVPKTTLDVPACFRRLFYTARTNSDLLKVLRAFTAHYAHPVLKAKGPPPSLLVLALKQCRFFALPYLAFALLHNIRATDRLGYLQCMTEEVYCEIIDLLWQDRSTMRHTLPQIQFWVDELTMNAVPMHAQLVQRTLLRYRSVAEHEPSLLLAIDDLSAHLARLTSATATEAEGQ